MSKKFRHEEAEERIKQEQPEEEDFLEIEHRRIFGPLVWRELPSGIKIKDIHTPHYDKVLELIEEHFFEEDILCKGAQFKDDEVSKKDYFSKIIQILREHASIIALDYIEVKKPKKAVQVDLSKIETKHEVKQDEESSTKANEEEEHDMRKDEESPNKEEKLVENKVEESPTKPNEEEELDVKTELPNQEEKQDEKKDEESPTETNEEEKQDEKAELPSNEEENHNLEKVEELPNETTGETEEKTTETEETTDQVETETKEEPAKEPEKDPVKEQEEEFELEIKEVVAGVLINKVVDVNDYGKIFSRVQLIEGQAHTTLKTFYNMLSRKVNIHERMKCEVYFRYYLLCLNPTYRHKGLGYQLMLTGLDLARSFKVPVIMGIFQTSTLQNYAKKLGMRVLDEIFYTALLDANKEMIFCNPGPGNYTCAIMAGELPPKEPPPPPPPPKVDENAPKLTRLEKRKLKESQKKIRISTVS